MKPTFIGLGAQKCASSWLHAIFADHPQAYVSTPKELDFFSSHYERGYQWYERHFEAATREHMAIGEISPSYLPDSDAPARAHAYNPDFRILIALRDPVERAYSNFLHDVRLGYYQSTAPSFEDALANNPMYIEQSRYARHLRRWMECFPENSFLIVLQEDIKHDPVGSARDVYDFLGIRTEHSASAINSRTNESYLPRSRKREEQIRSLGRLLRGNGLGWIDRIARQTGLLHIVHRSNRLDIRSVVPPLTDDHRAELMTVFADDVTEVAAIAQRADLPWATWVAANTARNSAR